MFKRCKVVMLPTNQQASIQLWGKWLFDCSDGIGSDREPKAINQHLYILSDDEIKEGDWIRDSIGTVRQADSADLNAQYPKIIATTNTSLLDYAGGIDYYKQSMGFPSQSFIKKYITEYNKGNVITDVLVEYDEIILNEDWSKNPVALTVDYQLKINPKDNTITIKKVKDSWSREEVRNLCEDAYFRGTDDGSDDPEIWHRDQTFDEWIENQL